MCHRKSEWQLQPADKLVDTKGEEKIYMTGIHFSKKFKGKLEIYSQSLALKGSFMNWKTTRENQGLRLHNKGVEYFPCSYKLALPVEQVRAGRNSEQVQILVFSEGFIASSKFKYGKRVLVFFGMRALIAPLIGHLTLTPTALFNLIFAFFIFLALL